MVHFTAAVYRSGRKAIGRVLHYAKQTYYSRIRRDSVCNTFQDPIITSVIDAKKITAWGESGFPARFLAVPGPRPRQSQMYRRPIPSGKMRDLPGPLAPN